MKILNRLAAGFAATLFVLLFAAFCRADGFIVIHDVPQPVPNHFVFAPLEVTYHRVSVEINDQVATTFVDEEFFNPNNARLEGTYMFPLPEGAHIDKFSMDMNGKMMDAELLSADKARAIYEDFVRRYKDPALLEYIGRDAFKVRIFPIEPNSRKHVKLQYTQLLKSDSGLVEYTYPLNTEKFSSKPLQDVSVKVSIDGKQPIKSVYSPSHSVDIRRDAANPNKAVIGYEDRNVRPDTDFKVIFSRSKDPIGIDLLTYRNGPDDGYFLLLASPGMDVARNAVQKKDICFVLDTSGSMAGPKLDQAKKALQFCLANLNEGDRFEIIRFSTDAEDVFGKLVDANKENIDKAQKFVADLKPIGGTAIHEALRKAQALRPVRSAPKPGDPPVEQIGPAEHPYIIIFLTDGLPTVGVTQEDPIVQNAIKDGQSTRIFCFGIGNDVNTHLLDRIANATGALSQYVLPQEDIEVKVSDFYTKIKEPVLDHVTVSFNGDIKTSQLYPNNIPDLFKGQMLTVFGRYSGKGPASVKITGNLNGQRKEFVTDVTFTERDTANQFIPRLWAMRRVGWLLEEIRLHGESGEVRDEVTRLARDWGIVTPYTSYLILEDETRRNVPLTMQTQREFRDDRMAHEGAKAQYDAANLEAADMMARTGEKALANASNSGGMKYSENEQQAKDGIMMGKGKEYGAGGGRGGPVYQVKPSAAATQPSGGYKVAQTYNQQARLVNGRAFYQNGQIWTDSTAQSKQNLKKQEIKFNSDEYFALLKQHPDIAQWLSLGDQVDVVVEDALVMVR
ncbi:MAG TPA: VIT domain-containing protein [Tepidisphaeraceae bacterium]|jgi:Ca-activated chloride channel family protein